MNIFGRKSNKFEHIRLQSTDSTNNFLKRLADESEPANFTVVSTVEQTKGRGQRGNSWESEKGKNLTFSIYLRPDSIAVKDQFIISEIVALAVKDTLSKYCSGISIKWPNDIYREDKKICGILIEHDTEDGFITRTIAGIGININQETFTSDAPNPISLKNITGREYDTDSILSEYVRHLQGRFARISSADDIHNEFRDSLYRLNEPHRFEDESGIFTGRITDVEPHGALTVEREDGTRRAYLFKEIKYII